jgi:N-acetylmuramoyl-L-alanine amidase
VEYQEGTNRIFIGDVKPASFTVRVDPLANGVRLTVQFTDKIAVRTASSNGKWVMFLGDRPMEPMEPSYHFQNPYLSDLQFDDQDGVPKLILSPTSTGLNFYPVQAEGGKILLADVLKPPPTAAQALPLKPVPQPTPAQPSPEGTTPQVSEESPAAPPGPPLPIVALDAGHGGADNGGHSRDGVWEKDLVAQYVARVRSALLATEKYRVVLSRTGDIDVSSDQRALAANLSGAICFLSFHAGDLGMASPRITLFTFQPPTPSAPTSADTQTPIFVPWGHVQEARSEQSLQLAVALQQQFGLLSGVEVDLPTTAPVRILRNVNAPAVAIEFGRLAPEQDVTALTNPAFQQQVAGAVVQALASFEKGGD